MKKFLLSLDEKVHQELKLMAATTGISMNDLIAKAVAELTKQEGVK